MKTVTAILGSVFILFVSVAAMENTQVAQSGTAAQAPQHQHGNAASCCDKADGMCARDGKTEGKCCTKDNCCTDDCCKDGKCDKDCKCECCKSGTCAKHAADPNAPAKDKAGCCTKAKAKKPTLVAAH